MEEGNKLQDQSRQLACCWKSTPHARPAMCLTGLERINILDLLLDLAIMSNGKEIYMTNSPILQWSRHVGAVHLLCTHNFLHGVLILGRHILQGQFIFTQDWFHRGICSDQTCMRKRPGSVRRLDHMIQLLSKGNGHRYTMQMAKFI